MLVANRSRATPLRTTISVLVVEKKWMVTVRMMYVVAPATTADKLTAGT
jgi:hypothetical protein